MSGTLATLLLGAALVSQPAAPRVPQPGALDPALDERLRPAVEAAAKAEVDPKRGPANAVEILKKARAKHPPGSELALALELRIAGTMTRKLFLEKQRFPVPVRYEQVLSTFARLDLTEPGLRGYLDRAIEVHPYAKAHIGENKQRRIAAAILTRGQALDKKQIARAFAKPLEALGFDFVIVPVKEAEMILKVAADNAAADQPGRRAVRLTLGIERLEDGKVAWEHSLYRTAAAPEVSVALESALDWIVRVGGRDLFFHWLGRHAFPSLGRVSSGLGGDHDHDQH